MGRRRFVRRKGKFSKNKKIKNATPLIVDGIQFKSKLEAFCYRHLKEAGIEAEYEKHTYTLISAFEYNGEKVRACTYTPDFVGVNWVIEVKGFMSDSFPLRWKMFRYMLMNEGRKLRLFLPRNQKEVLSVIEEVRTLENDIKLSENLVKS